jgi:Ca-activated chloride channel family protein
MQKEYSRSINDYVEAQATELDPVRSAAHYNRGNSLFRLDRLDEAREAYKETLRIDPNDRDAKFNIEVVDRIQEQRRQQEQQQQQQQPQPEPGSDNPAQQRPQGSTPGDENAGQDPGQNIEGNPGQQGNQPGPNPGAPDTGQQPGQNQGQQPQQGNPQGNQQQQPPPSQNPQLGQQPQPGQQAPGGQQNQQPGGQTPPPSVGEALPQFRQNLSPEEGLRLLDALRNEQRGLQGLIEGLPRNQIPRTRTPQPQDPLY